ncbi:hypothetical protein LP422_16365 [Janibacter limosus]|uniref:Uncharacterized protein n=1 Tax=Janibacter limosus TaxID=53458 RepID=A0AC61U2A1_9MICO|nr:hypothetical protein [Janibacter limosus]UUZ44137.1 hypothetical protein LP422_16365 [Janibacter limosus]
MWWIIGGIVLVIAGLGSVLGRRGGSMSATDVDGHGRAAAETIGTRNDNGGAGI